MPHAGETVKELGALGAKTIVISNQPGVAKKQISYVELQKMNQKIKDELAKSGAHLDGEYYCLHHPNARIRRYKQVCDCRKPGPGLLKKAANDFDLVSRTIILCRRFFDRCEGGTGCRRHDDIIGDHDRLVESRHRRRESAT